MDSEDKRAVGKKQKWSDSYTQYWINHTNCELCYGTASAPAHIKSRGAGVVIVKTIYYRYALRVTLNNIDRGGVGLYPKLHSLRRRYNYGIKI